MSYSDEWLKWKFNEIAGQMGKLMTRMDKLEKVQSMFLEEVEKGARYAQLLKDKL